MALLPSLPPRPLSTLTRALLPDAPYYEGSVPPHSYEGPVPPHSANTSPSDSRNAGQSGAPFRTSATTGRQTAAPGSRTVAALRPGSTTQTTRVPAESHDSACSATSGRKRTAEPFRQPADAHQSSIAVTRDRRRGPLAGRSPRGRPVPSATAGTADVGRGYVVIIELTVTAAELDREIVATVRRIEGAARPRKARISAVNGAP